MRAVMMAKPMPDFMLWDWFRALHVLDVPYASLLDAERSLCSTTILLEPSIVNQPHRMLDRAMKHCLPRLGKCECREAID
ncbi:hypothetical protein DdX_05304 [Ditylenchus destructor]|uniref:Uncharacterized protein n=1 Tax=Ditylenchus destructor TaxID=166010 RepID=A0AAD4N716_9BILA|nr:hypothetical protein DdX_05304 [Ditylenchus destructor]